jgi:UTP-glucose-1-phosphate uridylyltransferase
MGSRYGGLKQLDPVGPGNETIIDYSVYDAIKAGFGKVVFIIRDDFKDAFQKELGARFSRHVAVDYVYQEITKIPAPFTVPAGRTKPWGTSHAILMAKDAIKENFAVINGDDFYSRQGFEIMARFLEKAGDKDKGDYAMVGYTLRKTLSDHGSVARGICQLKDGDSLAQVVEHLKIERDGQGGKSLRPDGSLMSLTGDEPVSMNFWGFTPSVFKNLEEQQLEFFKTRGSEEKSEFLIPTSVDRMVRENKATVKVLRSDAVWFGVTYREDRPIVIKSVQDLISRGIYPASLW